MPRPYDPLIGPKKLSTIYKTQNMGARKKMDDHVRKPFGPTKQEFEDGCIGYAQLENGTIIEVDLDSMRYRCSGGLALCYAFLFAATTLLAVALLFIFLSL